jgi:hypothetical protein
LTEASGARLQARIEPEHVLLAVGLDEAHVLVATAGQAHELERLRVDREKAASRPVLRSHVGQSRAVGQRQARDPGAEVLDELSHDARVTKQLRHGQDEIGRGHATFQFAAQPHTDNLGNEHRDRLAEHRRLGFDPADAPTEHAEPVHHRRVRVGADERVGKGHPVAHLHHAGQMFEVDLVDDSRARRYDLGARESALAPAQEDVALAVADVFQLAVTLERQRARRLVDLNRVVDHELHRQARIDRARLAAQLSHGVAHRGQIDYRRYAGEILQ